MRNYIILNNQNSNTISGLIIQELAPISKPAQRTQVETIDGRDGDIVTPLGYAAYDKTITIGLYGNFNINDIIAYFATKGTVIFSNEPDKYYYYQIVDQIDYERLVRYRVATVTMHVQPFKYSATEGTITVDSSDTVSDEGSDIALDGTAEAPFNVLRHKGNATQDGTPTPDNPIEIKVLTGDSTVKITGKNLIDPSTLASSVFEGDLTNLYYYDANLHFALKAGQTYTLSAYVEQIGTTPYRFSALIGTGTGARAELGTTPNLTTVGGRVSVSFTVSQAQIDSAGGNNLFMRLPRYISPTTTHYKISDIQLELSNQATDYEEFKGQSYVIPFGDTYLAKIGDYADEPVKVDGTWYIRRAIGKVVLDGSEAWVYNSANAVFNIPNLIDYQRDGTAPMSDYFTGQSNVEGYVQLNDQHIALLKSTVSNRLIIKYTAIGTDVSDLTTWLSTHNTTVYYALATPTDEAITDQDLIDTLDDFINQAHAYKGHTHITATAADGNAPAVLAVDVNEDNESTVTNAGNTTSRPILTIYGQGDIGVYINDVEVLDVALGDEEYITLDSVEMEAYKDTTANLKNRLVTGDYSKLALNAGANKIRFTGKVTKYEISKYSRWL